MAVQIIRGYEVKIYMGDDTIGRASSFTARLNNSLGPYHEIGERDAVEILEGNRMIEGSLERAMISGELFARSITKSTLSGSTYTVDAGDYQYPITSVSNESISADDAETVFEFTNKPPIVGTVVIERDAAAWGQEGVDYVIDYINGYVTFASPPSSGNTWTMDYDYGRSYTFAAVAQVGDGSNQRTDVIIGEAMLDVYETAINNTGDVVSETVDFKAKTISGLYIGVPASGI